MQGDCEAKCPNCGDHIVKSYLEEVKLRAKVLKWTSKGLFAACRSCGADVALSLSLLKSIETRFEYELKGLAEKPRRTIVKKV